MATEKEIQLACDIQRAAIQINMQGKYCTFVEYSGHVSWLSVRVIHAPYAQASEYVKGLNGFDSDSYVQLSTGYKLDKGEDMQAVAEYKVERLETLKAELLTLLDVDADGVPV